MPDAKNGFYVEWNNWISRTREVYVVFVGMVFFGPLHFPHLRIKNTYDPWQAEQELFDLCL